MKGKITAIVLCSLVVGLMALLPAATAGGGGGGPSPTVFAGTYVAETEMFGGTAAFHTLSADGTMTGTNTNCCGAGGGAGLQGTVHGVWQQTGEREITLTAYGFVFAPQAVVVETHGPDHGIGTTTGGGQLAVTARITQVLTFDEDYETAEAVATTELWFGVVPDFEVDEPNMVVPWGDPDLWTRLHSNVQ